MRVLTLWCIRRRVLVSLCDRLVRCACVLVSLVCVSVGLLTAVLMMVFSFMRRVVVSVIVLFRISVGSLVLRWTACGVSLGWLMTTTPT